MNVTLPPNGAVGFVLALIALLLAILGLLHIVPFTAPVVFGELALVAAARLT